MRFLLISIFALLTALPVMAETVGGAPALSTPTQPQGVYTLDDDLLYRITFGSAEDVRLLLAKGANPNARNKQNESALEVAIERNDPESDGMAMALVEKGADVNATDKNGNPPIVDAIHFKQHKVVNELLNRGVDFHTKTIEGVSLIDYAKVHGDPEIVQMIQVLLDKEAAYLAKLRDPNRFKDIVRVYATDSCLYQYWSYYLSSRMDPDKDTETKQKIENVKKAIYVLINQVQQYYASTSTTALRNLSDKAVKQVYGDLDGLVSNRNRSEHGVGLDEDAKQRCGAIVDGLHIEFAQPVLSTGAYSNATQAATGKTPTQTTDPKAGAAQPSHP